MSTMPSWSASASTAPRSHLLVFLETVMPKCYETLVDSNTTVYVNTGMVAAARLQSLIDCRDYDHELLVMKVQLAAICAAVKSTVPQEMWGEIIEKLDEAEQHVRRRHCEESSLASPTTLKMLHEMPSTSSDWTARQIRVGTGSGRPRIDTSKSRSTPRRLSQSTCRRWSTYSVMPMRITLGSTILRRGYIPPRFARAEARSAACLCSAAVTTTASQPGYTVASWSVTSQRTT